MASLWKRADWIPYHHVGMGVCQRGVAAVDMNWWREVQRKEEAKRVMEGGTSELRKQLLHLHRSEREVAWEGGG